MHLHAAVAQRLGEAVVLLRARFTHRTSSKSRSSLLVGVSRFSSRSGPVQDRLAQPPDLGVDMEAMVRSSLGRSGHCGGAFIGPR